MESSYKINLSLFIAFLTGLIIVLLTGINKSLFMSINSYAASLKPFLWENLTFLGDTLPVAVLMLLFVRKRPDLVLAGILAAVIATIISDLLKYYTGILRPPAVLESGLINIIGPALTHGSFPSGHTITIFTLAGILIFYFRKWYIRTGLILLSLLVGISRIAVGVHWPADVLAGAALGVLCATAGVFLASRIGWKNARIFQLITGFLLLITSVYLLFYYDCRYALAIYLQYIFTSVVLVAGARDFYMILIERPRHSAN